MSGGGCIGGDRGGISVVVVRVAVAGKTVGELPSDFRRRGWQIKYRNQWSSAGPASGNLCSSGHSDA